MKKILQKLLKCLTVKRHKSEPKSALLNEVRALAEASRFIDREIIIVTDEALRQRLISDGWRYERVYFGLTNGKYTIRVPKTNDQYQETLDYLKKAFPDDFNNK